MSVSQIAARDYTPAQIRAWTDAEPNWDRAMAHSIVFAADDGGRLTGFVEYELPDHVGMTYVHPRYVRKGIGRALIAALEEEARRRGVATLHVEASITSRPFFETCGYTILCPQVVRVRGQEFLNYRMIKSIT